MVVALGPGKFYGSSLPRPRFYADVKFNSQRVDPPPPVMDPLMAWAREAHWSMGGLRLERHRLQGKIEGKIENLVKQKERERGSDKKSSKVSDASPWEEEDWIRDSPSPPPAPVAIKRRRVVGSVDEAEEARVKRVVRKLGSEFERAAVECGIISETDTTTANKNSDSNVTELKKKKRRLMKGGKTVGSAVIGAATRIRWSPRNSGRKAGTAVLSAALAIRSSPRLAARVAVA